MIIEIGERVEPVKGDKGDFGYPGMSTKLRTLLCEEKTAKQLDNIIDMKMSFVQAKKRAKNK